MTSNNATGTQTIIPWVSPQGKNAVRDIISKVVPQWPDGPRESQVSSWVRTLDCVDQLNILATGSGKSAHFYGPVLVAQYLRDHPDLRFRSLPRKPVALVVVPLIELGNNHVS